MKKHNRAINTAIGGLMALGLAGIAPDLTAAEKKDMEKCYGVAEAGKNDCQTAVSSCAGTSKQDGDPSAWIVVPKGTCDKIVGGSLSAGDKEG